MSEVIRTKHLVEMKGFEPESERYSIRITSKVLDRSNDRVHPEGLSMAHFMKNPVGMWLHDYMGHTPAAGIPITKTHKLVFDGDGWDAEFEFLKGDPFVDRVKNAWVQGFIRTASIGFQPKEWEKNAEGGTEWLKGELLEWSLVPIPDNPDALRRIVKNLIGEELMETQDKGVISYKQTPLAPEGEGWDAAVEVREATVDDLKIMCTWVGEEPENKTSYKLPHHKAGGGHACVWRGVAAAGGVMMGARGGTNIPEGDVGGVKAHLARHYKEFDKTPPWEAEGRSIEELMDDLDYLLTRLKALPRMPENIAEALRGLEPFILREHGDDTPDDILTKRGAVLNTKNKANLKEAQRLIQDVLDSAERESEETGIDPARISALAKERLAQLLNALPKN